MLPPKHCNINLTGPIPRWDEAIPLGNGILGSLFWGPMEHLRISVDIAGLWLRRRPEEKLDKEYTNRIDKVDTAVDDSDLIAGCNIQSTHLLYNSVAL